MHMLTLCLFVMMLTGTDSPATLPAQLMRSLSWDERAKELGRSARAESTGPLITGVRAVPLMLEVLPKGGWKPREWAGGSLATVTTTGVDYMFARSGDHDGAATRPGGSPQHVSLRIAVYPDRDTAILALGRGVLLISMGPQPLPNRVGDVAYVWPGPQDDHTSLQFRRDNVVVSLWLPVSKQEAIELGEKLDASLAAGGPNVEKGPRVKVPQVVLPTSMRVALGDRQHLRLELRDGDTAGMLVGTNDPSMIVRRSQDGNPELIYHAPKVAAEAGTRNITVIVATPMNVIARQQMVIEVAAAP